MKYLHPDWPTILTEVMKRKRIRQVDLARKLNRRPQNINSLLMRQVLKVTTLRKLSVALEEDLFVHLLARENSTVLKKAKAAGVGAGETNELLSRQTETEHLLTEKEDQATRLAALTAETTELKAANKSLEAELKKVTQEAQKQNEQQQAELDRLREEIKQLEFDRKLQVSVLEAKLEVLQGSTNNENDA